MFSKKKLASIIFFLAVFACPGFSQAEKLTVAVDRGIINLTAESGQDVEFSFSVRNDSPEKQKINLSTKDIVLGDDNALEMVEAQGGPSSLVAFAENDFALDPNVVKKVTGVMKFSQEKKEAAFYNMLILVSFSGAAERNDVSGPQVQGNIGIYTFVKIGENHNASGQIEKVSLAKFLKKENTLKIEYRNTGDVYFVPESQVRVRNIFGGFQQEIPVDKHFVFPGKKVFFSGKLDRLSPWGFFRVSVSFTDGAGGKQTVNKYACGYLFPAGAILFFAITTLVAIFIMRKRNQIKVEMIEDRI